MRTDQFKGDNTVALFVSGRRCVRVSRLPSLPSTIANEGRITPLPGRTMIRRHRVTNRPTLPGGSELRIVALTARGMRAEHQRAFDAGCDDVTSSLTVPRRRPPRPLHSPN